LGTTEPPSSAIASVRAAASKARKEGGKEGEEEEEEEEGASPFFSSLSHSTFSPSSSLPLSSSGWVRSRPVLLSVTVGGRMTPSVWKEERREEGGGEE
jgi:hypothetical protein